MTNRDLLERLRQACPDDSRDELLIREAADEIESYRWHPAQTETPTRHEPVLCAWRFGPKWHYAVAKYTGKRWLDVVPEADNEEFQPPVCWQYVRSPDEPSGDDRS